MDPRVRVTISHDPEAIKAAAPEADIVLYATMNPGMLTAALPFATRARWIHSMWTGVEGILGPEMLRHPAPLTNGRGVFRWQLRRDRCRCGWSSSRARRPRGASP
jgi:hypothetical protein